MQFADKEAPVIPVSIAESLSQSTDNDSQELILNSIINDIIKVSKFARDIDDEVYALMTYCDTTDYIALDEMEFVTVIYWFGLLKGVELDAQDIEKIIDSLKYYVVVNGDYADFIDEDLELMEVNQ